MNWQSVFGAVFCSLSIVLSGTPCSAGSYPIVDTGQERCYDDRVEIAYPKDCEPFFGQDSQYQGNRPAYRDNGDGTVTDLVTGLMWQKDPGEKKTFEEAVAGASSCRVGGYDDWRLPSIKELYSLILFSGEDVNPHSTDVTGLKPFIDAKYFDFSYGDTANGERIIDSQMATSTKYVSTTMHGNETVFGVNFADGRIKGYPAKGNRPGRGAKKFYVFYVRGNPEYGKNQFHDNGDDTITDRATGLTWMKLDSGHLSAGQSKDGRLNWEQALRWAEGLEFVGHSDWRLPNIKELHSIVDYTRSPDTTRSAAIDPIFSVTPVRDGLGKVNYPFYWSSTTHVRDGGNGATGCYVAFGRSQGWMRGRFGGEYDLLDVHGAGSQRSDPKAGDPSQFPRGRGPQGDVIAIYNMVRLVRGGDVTFRRSGPELETQRPPQRRPGPRRPARPGFGPNPQRGRGETPPFLQRFDRNRDGEVTRREFDGPPWRFNMLDRNGDGVVSQDEAASSGPPGLAPRRPAEQNRREGGRPSGPQRRQSVARPAPNEPSVTRDADKEVRADDAWKELPPSFVFILADDMGWTGLSTSMDDRIPDSQSDFYQTPRIDELARQGMRFSNAYSPSSMCTPSRASILTGKSPALTRMTTPGRANAQAMSYRRLIPPRHVDALPESETTVAEVLREHGYATAHFGKWHLSGGGPGRHGFDRHDGETGNNVGGEYDDPNPKDIFGITDRAVAFMQGQVAQGKPFYLQLSHYAVHSPQKALAATIAEYAERPSGERHNSVVYAAMTRDLDTGVGTVLDCIERLGITENTYVIFMSDNGATGGPRRRTENLPLAGGKATFWEGGVRVPLIIRGPGVAAGSSCHARVVGFDLLPTCCDLAGVAGTPDDVEGGSLKTLLANGGEGAVERPRADLVFHFPHYAKGPEQSPQSAIYRGEYKLLRIYETNTNHLFKLSEDLGEQRDLADSMPEKVEEMEKALFAYLREVKAQMPVENPNYDPRSATPRGRGSGGRAEAHSDRRGIN